MLTDYYPPHTGGGVERVVDRLARGLAQRGHTVAVLALRTVPAPPLEAQGPLSVCRVPALDLTGRLGFQFALSFQVFPALVRWVQQFRPHLVHAHNLFFRTTEAAALLRGLFSAPLVTTLHLGRMERARGPLPALVRAYEAVVGRFILLRSDHITAVSRAVAEHARRLVGHRKPITVVPPGVDASRFFPREGGPLPEKRVLFVGRLVPNKGPDILLSAVPRVLARHPQARFLLVGEGPLRARLEEQVCRMGVQGAVQFVKFTDDIPSLMRGATVFVRPSLLEGMPLTVLEALASGVPVVATPVAGVPELVQNGVNGYLVPVGDVLALAEAICHLLDDPVRAREMGLRGRSLVISHYTWERLTAQMEAVYQQVLSSEGAG